jgi:hypothetical protein
MADEATGARDAREQGVNLDRRRRRRGKRKVKSLATQVKAFDLSFFSLAQTVRFKLKAELKVSDR